MLTITAPIELKCKTSDNSMHEGFYHRITDPYSMMTSKLTPEDLLHVVSTPPEYYFGGEEEINFFRQTNVSTHQENKLEVINNLVNRIAVSESAQLTYQDRVYITDILQKIGIHNVSEFMKQVRLIKEEQNQTNRLINLYWNYAGELKQLVEDYRSTQVVDQHKETYEQQTDTLHLHEDILNRLQTAAIYQTVQNFNGNSSGDYRITNTQLKLSEQYGFAQQILLQKLKNEVRGEAAPLIFRHENYYENQQLSEEEITEQKVLTQVSSAVLLDMVNNVYRSQNEQYRTANDNWYHMEQAFYQNAENTMQRFENHMSNRYQTNVTSAQVSLNRQQELINQEIDILNRLFEQRDSDLYQTVNELLYQDITSSRLVNRMHAQTDELQLTNVENRASDFSQENYFSANDLQIHQQNQQIFNQNRSTVENEQTQIQNKYQKTVENIRENIERTAARSQEEFTEKKRAAQQQEEAKRSVTQINVDASEQNVYEDNNTFEQTQYIDQRDLSSVEQELSRINRQNINNQSKYIRMMEGIRESLEHPKETRSPEQMRREGLMALEHPTELLEKLRAEGQQQQEEQQMKLSHVMNLLPEQTREVYEIVREYLEAPAQVRRQMQNVTDDVGVLIRDINQTNLIEEQTKLVHKSREQLHDKTMEVIERWNEKQPVEPQKKQVYEEKHADVTMVHRSQEHQLNEEEIRQMIEQNRLQNRTVHTQNETITNIDTTQRQFTNINTQQLVEQTENVSELVHQSVQRELGALSEKIYHKLEKRLETEKRRRGY